MVAIHAMKRVTIMFSVIRMGMVQLVNTETQTAMESATDVAPISAGIVAMAILPTIAEIMQGAAILDAIVLALAEVQPNTMFLITAMAMQFKIPTETGILHQEREPTILITT